MKTTQETRPQTHWHALHLPLVFTEIAGAYEGLTSEEARKRLSQHGANRLRPPKARGPVPRFVTQFNNVLVYVLVMAGVITAALQHWVDSGVIFSVIVINAIIGFVQEGKAEQALEAIRNLLSQNANVCRGRAWHRGLL